MSTEQNSPPSHGKNGSETEPSPGERRQGSLRDRRRRVDEPAREPPRRGRVSSGLALILAAIAVVAVGYLWYTLLYQRQDLLAIDLPEALARLEHETRDLKKGLGDTGSQVATVTETQETLKAALDKVQAELGRNRAEWIVSEAEQLLLIANRRLQLARDVNSALAALRAADRQLELLASPALLPVRRELSKEIHTLESVERTDIAGISLTLAALADSVDRLPLARELRVATVDGSAVDRTQAGDGGASFAGELWRDIASLVRIRHHDAAQQPLLPPDQQYFLRENLRLMLYGAQHALLQGNVATYQQNMQTAATWLAEHFDPASQAVATARAEVEKLRATRVMTELPDITGSLELLRKTGRRQEP